MKTHNVGQVKVYAHAVVSLTAACNTSTFTYLKKKLIVGNYETPEVNKIIQKIQHTYRCLDLRCKDIGHFDGLPNCKESDELQSIGDYMPVTYLFHKCCFYSYTL